MHRLGTIAFKQRLGMMPCTSASVLVVEDEAFVAWDLSQTIENSGRCVVGPAANVAAGLALAEASHMCAAVLDINLGNDAVWPLADELQARGVPFGFLSANLTHAELTDRFADAPRLSKPVRDIDLMEMVDDLVARSSC